MEVSKNALRLAAFLAGSTRQPHLYGHPEAIGITIEKLAEVDRELLEHFGRDQVVELDAQGQPASLADLQVYTICMQHAQEALERHLPPMARKIELFFESRVNQGGRLGVRLENEYRSPCFFVTDPVSRSERHR